MTVTIEIDPTWAKIVRSPVYYIVASLTGVSISFCPLFLYWSGKGMFNPKYQWLIVPLLFVIIFVVPFFYMSLGSMVIKELRKSSK